MKNIELCGRARFCNIIKDNEHQIMTSIEKTNRKIRRIFQRITNYRKQRNYNDPKEGKHIEIIHQHQVEINRSNRVDKLLQKE